MLINRSINQSINGSINKSVNGASGGSSVPNMQNIIPSANFDADATVAESFTSGQTWANLVASPFDSEAQTAYDLQLGATSGSSTDDPTFTGSAGDSAAYFACDGGDLVTLVNTNANAPFFNKLHMGATGQKWWYAWVFKSSTSAASQYILNAADGSSGNHGMSILLTSGGALTAFQSNGSANVSMSGANGNLSFNTDNLVIATYDRDAGLWKIYVNGTLVVDLSSITFNADATDATYAYRLGGLSGGAIKWGAGTRLYAFSGGDSFLSQTDVNAIKAEYDLRHGRSY